MEQLQSNFSSSAASALLSLSETKSQTRLWLLQKVILHLWQPIARLSPRNFKYIDDEAISYLNLIERHYAAGIL